MGDLSIFYGVQILSSVVYSFNCRGLSLPLSLFLSTLLFFSGCCKWNCFPIFFLSLLVYRKATDFCKLILYSDTLLKVFMMLKSFLFLVEKGNMFNVLSIIFDHMTHLGRDHDSSCYRLKI
jgi:hypothetical protein